MKRLLLALALISCTAPAATAATPSATPEPTATPSPTSTPIILLERPWICASTDLCYPRVFLSAPVVDQYDPAQALGNDVGREHWYDDLGIFIAGHAYITPMGAILQWQAGDDVVVFGQHYTVFDAVYRYACVPFVALPPAKVYLMTSASNDSCASGLHQNIIVLAR